MSGVVIPWEDLSAKIERDRQVFRMRLAGHSERAVAEELQCPVEDVQTAMIRMTGGGLTEEMRERILTLELSRLDDLAPVYYERAKKGEYEALFAILKIGEARAKLTGLNKAPADPNNLGSPERNRESSTVALMNVLDRLCGKTPMIEGEVVEVPEVEEAKR